MKLTSMKKLLYIIIIINSVGCSSLLNKIAVQSTGAVLSEANDEVLSEGNWEVFKNGLPGNLKLMEGLHFVDPTDKNVMSSLIKGYAGYAFVVNETMAMAEEFSDQDNRPNRDQAIYNYSKAVLYGEKFLKSYGVSLEEILKKAGDKKQVNKYLDKVGTNKFERETLFFLAQAYGGLILFNRDDMSMISKRPMVKAIFDYVCAVDPDFNSGACDIFEAVNLSLTPTMMGGNPSKGFEIFTNTIKKFPENYFVRIALMQFYSIPLEEEDVFKENLVFLSGKEKEFKAKLEFSSKSNDNFSNNKINLFQSVAFKRLEILKKFKNKFF